MGACTRARIKVRVCLGMCFVSFSHIASLTQPLSSRGSVDATVHVRSQPTRESPASSGSVVQDSLMPIELKTGHNQNPSQSHMAQLSCYTVMLRARHGTASTSTGVLGLEDGMDDDMEAIGAASSGMLLYLNGNDVTAGNVKPLSTEVAALLSTRNTVASNVLKASRPRGLTIEYQDENRNKSNTGRADGRPTVVVTEPPPTALPELSSSSSSCERCYKNRECMMYAAADASFTAPSSKDKHERLRQHYTRHLQGADLEYFRKWDRLIDLEKEASVKDSISKSWMFGSSEKEAADANCISSLVIDSTTLSAANFEGSAGDGDKIVRFLRSDDSALRTPLTNLNIDEGSYVILSEDGTSFVPKTRVASRRRLHILRGQL